VVHRTTDARDYYIIDPGSNKRLAALVKSLRCDQQWWAQLTEKLASITNNPLTRKLASLTSG